MRATALAVLRAPGCGRGDTVRYARRVSRVPSLPYVVVDTNRLRVPEVVEPLLAEFDRTGQRIMLPWTSTYELTKGIGNNFVKSVRLLMRRPEAISVATAAIVLFRHHEVPLRTLVSDVTDEASTSALRDIIGRLATGSLSECETREGLAPLARRAADYIGGLGFESLFRNTTEAIVTKLAKTERNAIGAALRAGDRGPMRRTILSIATPEGLAEWLVAIRVDPEAAQHLSRLPSLAALTVLAPITASFPWAVLGGLESTKDPPVNRGVDMESVLIALYGRNLVTKDEQARWLYEDLRAMADDLWP
jgi:hypothetical protein